MYIYVYSQAPSFPLAVQWGRRTPLAGVFEGPLRSSAAAPIFHRFSLFSHSKIPFLLNHPQELAFFHVPVNILIKKGCGPMTTGSFQFRSDKRSSWPKSHM